MAAHTVRRSTAPRSVRGSGGAYWVTYGHAHIVKVWLLGLLCASPAAFRAVGKHRRHATTSRRAWSARSPRSGPDRSFWVALELNIRDGWHTYWRNPGDSGQATKLAGQLPPGFTRRRHRLDHAAPLRAPAAGQLRLCQACRASGADHGAQGSEGRRAGRARGQGELAGVLRCLHSRKMPNCS